MKLFTRRKYDFFECSSAMQKAIRRNDTKLAGYFGIELAESNYHEYVWKRLMIISAEDCDGIVTKEILALYQAFQIVVKGKETKRNGMIFIVKAIIILVNCRKNRDADHLLCFVCDEKLGTSDEEINQLLQDATTEPYVPIPEYAFDCHTMKGKRSGKTKQDFYGDEFNGLKPRVPGLFDNLLQEKINQ